MAKSMWASKTVWGSIALTLYYVLGATLGEQKWDDIIPIVIGSFTAISMRLGQGKKIK